MPIDLHKLISNLPNDRRKGAVELGQRIISMIGHADMRERDYVALVRVFESYLGKYGINIGYSAKQAAENWYEQITYIGNLTEDLKGEIDADEVAREALDLFEEFDGIEDGSKPFGYAYLHPDEKKTIHTGLDTVRSIIEKSKLSPRKKRALYDRLNKLAFEVDKDGTLSDSFFSFGIDLAMVAREMEETARPAIEQVKEILKIIFQRRAENEGVQLPRPDDIPLLPPASKK